MTNAPPRTLTTDLDPLIIASPTVRSGTTLLQRLLCSSTNSLIYGENCGQDLELFLSIYQSKAMMYDYYKQRFAASLNKVMSGEVNDWILDLMPDVDGYLGALGRSCFSGLAYCRDYAVGRGRPLWGFKYPGWKAQTIHMARRVMPRCRMIYVYRDVVDCLKSAKAKQIIRSEQETVEFCRQWADSLGYALDIADDPAVLILRFSDLTGRPGETLSQIAEFSGAREMSLEVLSHKINAWPDDGDRQGGGYIKPADLTERESQIVCEVTAALRSRLFA